MALSSGFFNSVGADRLYDASDFANYLKDIVSNGFLPADSGFKVTANPAAIGANPPSVIIGVGKAYLNGLWCVNNATIVYPLGATQLITDGSKYLVYLCFDTTDEGRDATLGVVTGTTPVLPSDTGGLYYLPLARIVDQQNVQPVLADITDLRVAASVLGATGGGGGGDDVDTFTLADADRTVLLWDAQLGVDKVVNNQKIDLFAGTIPARTYDYRLCIDFTARIAYTGTGINTTPSLYIRDSTVAYDTATATPAAIAGEIFIGYPNCFGMINGIQTKAIQWSGSYTKLVLAGNPVNLKFTVASATTVTVYSTGIHGGLFGDPHPSATHATVLQIPAGYIA